MSGFGRSHGGLPKMRSRALFVAAMVLGATGLCGCWTPPRIPDRAPGEPGVVAQGLRAATTRTDLVVQAVDSVRHTVTLLDPRERTTVTYSVDPKVGRAAALHLGQRVKVTLIARLTVYVRGPDQSAPPGTPNSPATAAKVAAVDASYRLLTVQLRGGLRETFKLPLEVETGSMHSGDDVAILPDQVMTLSSHRSVLGLRND
jgi:hypothetical protein